MAVFDRLIREMKASPPKAGVLIVLAAVGMYFWIPPIWSAIAGGKTASPARTETAAPEVSNPVASVAPPASPAPLHWPALEQIRKSDLLFQSAAISEVNANAFGASKAALPAVAEVEQEPDELSTEESTTEIEVSEEEQTRVARLELDEVARQLSLRSTIIGPVRRAAVINNRVYSEGDVVVVAGRRARIQSVEARRVKLQLKGEFVELRIDPFASSQVRLDR